MGFPEVMSQVASGRGLTCGAMGQLAGGCVSDWAADVLVRVVHKLLPFMMNRGLGLLD